MTLAAGPLPGWAGCILHAHAMFMSGGGRQSRNFRHWLSLGTFREGDAGHTFVRVVRLSRLALFMFPG